MKAPYMGVILIGFLALSASVASGQANRTDFTGTDTGLGPLPPPPIITQQGNTVHIRGLNGHSHLVLQRADGSVLFDGTGYFTLNANWSLSDFTGPVWGPFRFVDSAGNEAELMCEAVRRLVGPTTWQGVFHCTGLGTGGTFDGKLFKLTETIITHVPLPTSFVGDISGSMLDPASEQP